MRITVLAGFSVALSVLVSGCSKCKDDITKMMAYGIISEKILDNVVFGEYAEQKEERRTYRCTGTVRTEEDLYVVNTSEETVSLLPRNANWTIVSVAHKKGDFVKFEAFVKRKKGFHQAYNPDNWVRLAGAAENAQPKPLSQIKSRLGRSEKIITFPSDEFTVLMETEKQRQQNVTLSKEKQQKRDTLLNERAKLVARQREIGTLLQKATRVVNSNEKYGTGAAPQKVRLKLRNDERMIVWNKRLDEIKAEMTQLNRSGVSKSVMLSPELKAEYTKKQTEKRTVESSLGRSRRDAEALARKAKSPSETAVLEEKRMGISVLEERVEKISRELTAIEKIHTARLDELKNEQVTIQQEIDGLNTATRQEMTEKNEVVADAAETQQEKLIQEKATITTKLAEIAKALDALNVQY